MNARVRRLVVAPDEFAKRGAELVLGLVARALDARERASVALAGGNTPRPLYQAIAHSQAARRISWERVDLYFGDERCVPPDDPESNYRSTCETLLAEGPLTAACVHRMAAESPDRDAAADAYAAVLPERLDVLILGMGPEGHTASLFPGSPALAERGRLVVPVMTPKPPPARLTVTPPVIEAAREILVLAAGREKADAVRRALEGPWEPERVPVQLARRGLFLLDVEAASGLEATVPNASLTQGGPR